MVKKRLAKLLRVCEMPAQSQFQRMTRSDVPIGATLAARSRFFRQVEAEVHVGLMNL